MNERLKKEGYSAEEIEMISILMNMAKTCLHRPIFIGTGQSLKLMFCKDCGSHLEKNPGEPDVVYRITRFPDGTHVGYTDDF